MKKHFRKKNTVRNALFGVGFLIVGVLLWLNVQGTAGLHPAPRAEVTGEHVVPSDRYAAYPQVADVYQIAAQIPQVLDGLYCYCDCQENFSHYSLLDCFRSDHGAGCDICLAEAVIAWNMTRDGAGLAEIREVIDQQYGA